MACPSSSWISPRDGGPFFFARLLKIAGKTSQLFVQHRQLRCAFSHQNLKVLVRSAQCLLGFLLLGDILNRTGFDERFALRVIKYLAYGVYGPYRSIRTDEAGNPIQKVVVRRAPHLLRL